MSKVIRVICPEHEQSEIIEVTDTGDISWCSRVAGRPVCGKTCLPMAAHEADKEETPATNNETLS
jgi:hypothetical protein